MRALIVVGVPVVVALVFATALGIVIGNALVMWGIVR